MWRRIAGGLLLAALALVPFTAGGDSCTPFNGYFVAQFDTDVPGPPYLPGYQVHCPDSTLFPVRQCTHGQLYPDVEHTSPQDLAATYEFSFTSQTADPNGRLNFTGKSIITLAATGDVINANDHGYLMPSPDANGQAAAFETTVVPYEICSGDRCKPLRTAEDTPGNPDDVSYIVAGPGGSGSLNLVNNTSSGKFIGQICHKY